LYGIERLCEVISRHWDQSAEAIKQAVVDDVTRFIGKHKVYDDLTLVVLKQK
jgi:sigma-B regulation protein RsbU (phosphoserine phosphatase)